MLLIYLYFQILSAGCVSVCVSLEMYSINPCVKGEQEKRGIEDGEVSDRRQASGFLLRHCLNHRSIKNRGLLSHWLPIGPQIVTSDRWPI